MNTVTDIAASVAAATVVIIKTFGYFPIMAVDGVSTAGFDNFNFKSVGIGTQAGVGFGRSAVGPAGKAD